jgi:hypothetical protein
MKIKINKEARHSVNASPNTGPPERSPAENQTGQGERELIIFKDKFKTQI